jgi:hypothetical protein
MVLVVEVPVAVVVVVVVVETVVLVTVVVVIVDVVVCTVPSVFGRNLQCEPVRKVDTERNTIGHTPARFKRAGVGTNGILGWKTFSVGKRAPYTCRSVHPNRTHLQCLDGIHSDVCQGREPQRGVLLGHMYAGFNPSNINHELCH